MDINTSIITILTGMIGILCGAAAGSYFNLKSARKDILFKRKLAYFEKLVQDIEKNLRLYKKVILPLSESSKIKEIEQNVTEIKQERKNFLVMASPLYFDVKKMTERMTNFVNIEKSIFSTFENLEKNYKNGPSRARNLFELNEALQKLNKAGEIAILEMRRELYNK
jgi:hypothetical protein